MTQTEANRANAQKSTGPRTEAGKARSAANATTHGIYATAEIIPGEDPAALQALEAAYLDRHRPTDCSQMLQVKIMVRADWELDRLSRAEAQLWEHALTQAGADLPPNTALGQAFALKETTFARLGRRQDATRRAYEKALHELERLQSQSTDPEPIEPKPETGQMASFRQPAPPPPAEPREEPATPAAEASAPPPPSEARQRPATFNPRNPEHPPIELCFHCSEQGFIGDRCYYRPRKRP